ncbi:MAG: hypothetical protein ABI553_00470 [Chloroflexota bacterium]
MRPAWMRWRTAPPILAVLLILVTTSIATATEFPAGKTGYQARHDIVTRDA